MNPERNIEQDSAGRSGSQFVPVIRTGDCNVTGRIDSRESLDTWLDQQLVNLELRFGDWTTAASLKAAFRKGRR